METNMNIRQIYEESRTKAEFIRRIGFHKNGKGQRAADKLLKEHGLSWKDKPNPNAKYEIVEKECPVCGTPFEAKLNHPKEKQTCSYSCSNTYFRSGKGNGMYSGDNYRTVCFNHHDKKCIVCGEDKIVAVHHVNENHDDNRPENLVPLCPTHHHYVHSKYSDVVQPIINEYLKTKQLCS